MILRQLRDTDEDAEAAWEVVAAAFGDSAALAGKDGWPPGYVAEVHERHRHLARTDPGGCWLALDEAGMPLGVTLSARREGTWGLSMFAVLPRAQRQGVGRELLAAALLYGRGCLRGIICGSEDPRAASTYRRAGFALHPAMRLRGTVGPETKERLSPPDGAVHEGVARHRDLLDSVDRRTRGGAHGADHELLLTQRRLLVVDDLAGSGYCYVGEDGKVEMLAATSRRLAKRLLTAALLCLPEGAEARVPGLTAEQQWAVDVGIEAGLELSTSGYVCLRGMPPPMPYIPSGTFL
ncbi:MULTISPECIES: GNAT family N-acetyltransferase [Streptomyces violaceusniger group]|uniref:N-acetyltransferase domain-containing protein n=2 Tax=Streptomyces javensis TaxID=114698 RepID=A0ABP4HJ56_9ACTN|nr:GNAT family N-acetyltransferase [Streptomyces javensis]MBI0312947.1 GNAT family N-acetyltransferase [Streptomyces javensis]